MKSLEDLILSTRKNLQSAGISEYLLEAELIWMKALNLDRANLYLEFNESPNARSLECAERLISRRMTREPLAYIIGKIEFFGKEFDIKPGVLIPRQDTETVVEEAIKILDEILSDKKPKPGSYRGRLNAEPENNRKTLLDVKNA